MTQGIANVCHIAISGDCCEILTITVAVINADTFPKCCIVRKSLENSTHPILEMVKAAVSSALLLLMGSFGNVARNVSNATLSICVSILVWHGQEVKCHRWWVTDPPWPPVVRFSFFFWRFFQDAGNILDVFNKNRLVVGGQRCLDRLLRSNGAQLSSDVTTKTTREEKEKKEEEDGWMKKRKKEEE